jgi:hypothetical protein
VFRTAEERKKEPAVYEGVRAAARKRKNAPDVEESDDVELDAGAENRPEKVVDSEVVEPAAKKRKTSGVEAGDEVAVAGEAE